MLLLSFWINNAIDNVDYTYLPIYNRNEFRSAQKCFTIFYIFFQLHDELNKLEKKHLIYFTMHMLRFYTSQK